MGRRKIDSRLEGIIEYLLKKGTSYRNIQKELKGQGHEVSVSTIHRVKHSIGKSRDPNTKRPKSGQFRRRPTKSTDDVVRKVAVFIQRVNPPTQREMAQRLGVSQATINRIIKRVLQSKLRKKCKVHKLNPNQIEKRRQRSWRLYLRLNNNQWKNFVTTDEAMFYLGGSYGRRRVCYYRKGVDDPSKLKFVKRDSFAPGFMAWAGVSFHGKTDIRIIDKGVKVNSDFYINKVLKPFVEKDLPRMFPEDQIKDMVFHQDSASSHTSKHTLAYLRQRKINFVTPEEWMPKSPDAAPMDFGIWGILKRRLQKRKIYTLAGLKRALKDEWNKLEQSVINKTLQSWPKRCRLIYNMHGSHIEHLLQ